MIEKNDLEQEHNSEKMYARFKKTKKHGVKVKESGKSSKYIIAYCRSGHKDT